MGGMLPANNMLARELLCAGTTSCKMDVIMSHRPCDKYMSGKPGRHAVPDYLDALEHVSVADVMSALSKGNGVTVSEFLKLFSDKPEKHVLRVLQAQIEKGAVQLDAHMRLVGNPEAL